MKVRRPGSESRGLPLLLMLAVIGQGTACAGGVPAESVGTDVRTSRLDLSYAPQGGDAAAADPDAADAQVGEPGPGNTEAGAEASGCVDPIDWQCIDNSAAQRCTQGHIEIRECGESETCDGGICFPFCPVGTANCSHVLSDGCNVDTTSDPAHCGNCVTTCGDADCVQGACACASASQTATRSPLDMYIMMDQSSSMDEATGSGLSKWDAVSQALRAFVADAGSAGIGVGIQYFPIITGGWLFETESCDVADYAQAETAIQVLPGNATAIINSMNSHSPYGNTPTHPALKGAVDHARAHALAHPTHTVVVVLATDGEPTECDPQDIPTIATVASTAAAGTPGVLTFVVGVGSLLTSLDRIAVAGGTHSAFVVDQGGNVVQQFAAALQAIQGQALGCTYAIPAPTNGQALNYEKVNVQVTLGGAPPAQLGYVETTAACAASGGWTYDDPVQPNKILLCPATCTGVTGDATAKVDILLGCTRTVTPPDTHH